jgi:hypothetical protein
MVDWEVCLLWGKWRKSEWVKALVTRMEEVMVLELREREEGAMPQP